MLTQTRSSSSWIQPNNINLPRFQYLIPRKHASVQLLSTTMPLICFMGTAGVLWILFQELQHIYYGGEPAATSNDYPNREFLELILIFEFCANVATLDGTCPCNTALNQPPEAVGANYVAIVIALEHAHREEGGDKISCLSHFGFQSQVSKLTLFVRSTNPPELNGYGLGQKFLISDCTVLG